MVHYNEAADSNIKTKRHQLQGLPASHFHYMVIGISGSLSQHLSFTNLNVPGITPKIHP